MQCNPSSLNAAPGGSTSSNCIVASLNGFNNAVNLDCQNLPSGISCVFNPSQVTPPPNNSIGSLLMVTVNSSVQPGNTYYFQVKGTSGNIIRIIDMYITITASSDFTISCDPSSISGPIGGNVMSTCTLTSLNNFNSAVNLSCQNLPSGSTCSFNPPSPTVPSNGSISSQLTFNIGTAISPGIYSFQANGASGILTHSISVSLNVYSSNPLWARTLSIQNIKTSGVLQTPDEGFIISGTKIDGTYLNGLIIKLNAQGIPQWQKLFSSSFSIEANAIRQTIDGNYIIAGRTSALNYQGSHFWVLELDQSGNIIWQKAYGAGSLAAQTRAHDIQQTLDNGFIVVGETYAFGVGHADFWVLKLDPTGNIKWQRTYGGSAGSEFPHAVRQTIDGGYVVAGFTNSFGAGQADFWIIKLDANGNIQWQNAYGRQYQDIAYDIRQIDDGGYIIGGSTDSSSGPVNSLVIKIDSSGSIEWSKTYGNPTYGGEIYSIEKTFNNGVILIGTTSEGTGQKLWILQLDNSGNIQWQHLFGSTAITNDPEDAFSVSKTTNNGYVVVHLGGFDLNMYMKILKLNSSGDILSCSLESNSSIVPVDVALTITNTNAEITNTSIAAYDISPITITDVSSTIFELCSSLDPRFSISCNPSLLSIMPGGNGSSTCTITSFDGFNSPVNLSCQNIPSSINCSFNPNPVTPLPDQSVTSALTVSANSSASTGSYPFKILGNSSSLDEIYDMTCNVIGALLQPFTKAQIDDSGSSTPNGIIEPNESINLIGHLKNTGAADALNTVALLSTLAAISIPDPNASYGTIAVNGDKTCSDCYNGIIAPLTNRPGLHWDFTVTENVTADSYGSVSFNYTYHVGNSFNDVAPTFMFYPYIETLLHSNIVSGCTSNTYCPNSNVQRQQMAKFICGSMEASSSGSCTIGICQNIFADVNSSNIFCPYIEALYNAGIVSGCQINPQLLYCPTNITQRQAMAKFVCKGMDSSNPGSCSISACANIFTDVPTSNPFCPYIEALYNAGVVSGCASNAYCPTSNVSRAQMAKFLVNGFGLLL